MRQLTENDYIFDGFAHRNFIENVDGWRNRMPDPYDYPAVAAANSVLNIFDELCAANRRIWELEKKLEHYEAMAGKYPTKTS